MSNRATELLAKAEQAKRPYRREFKWEFLLPTIERLTGKGWTVTAVFDWLVEEKEIKAEERRSAYNSVMQRFARQKRRTSNG